MTPEEFDNEQTAHSYREDGRMAEFHRSYEQALDRVREDAGGTYPLVVDGRAVETEDAFVVTSPGDRDLEIGEFAAAGPAEVDRAVDAAADAFEEWRAVPWAERVARFRAAAERMRDRKFELAATLTLEAGKSRTEAVADVDEAIDFLGFYARELERNEGYAYDTGDPPPDQHCTNWLVPFGVFGVVAPFNFPCAIFTGMVTGAAITGNAVVAKPASATPWIAHKVVDVFESAGLPDGVVNLVTGGGSDVGDPLVEHADVDGVAFTGSREVGRHIRRTFFEAEKPGPVIAELGGKNPVIVTERADLSKAVSGVAYGAFGFGGQKCSATSRVYVHRSAYEEFVERLVERSQALDPHTPGHEEAVVAPLIDDDALDRYRDVCERARAVGTIEAGGKIVASDALPNGRYVLPTVATGVPHGNELAREEHFLPFVTVHPVESLDEAIERANDSRFGLCAGLFSEDAAEVETWLDRIEAGMCYVNREQSATTGALVGAQPFGGWKASGTTSKFAGGYWYLPQFMREQSSTVVGDVGRE